MRFIGRRGPSFVNKAPGYYETYTVAGTNNLCKYIAVHYRDINHALLACDRAAMYFKHAINGHDIANIGRDCDAWLKTFLYRKLNLFQQIYH